MADNARDIEVQARLLDGYLKQLAREPAAAAPGDLDPEVAATALQLRQLTPGGPSSAFVERLAERLAIEAQSLGIGSGHAPAMPAVERSPNGRGNQLPPPLALEPRRFDAPAPPRSWRRELLGIAAAIVVLALVAALLAAAFDLHVNPSDNSVPAAQPSPTERSVAPPATATPSPSPTPTPTPTPNAASGDLIPLPPELCASYLDSDCVTIVRTAQQPHTTEAEVRRVSPVASTAQDAWFGLVTLGQPYSFGWLGTLPPIENRPMWILYHPDTHQVVAVDDASGQQMEYWQFSGKTTIQQALANGRQAALITASPGQDQAIWQRISQTEAANDALRPVLKPTWLPDGIDEVWLHSSDPGLTWVEYHGPGKEIILQAGGNVRPIPEAQTEVRSVFVRDEIATLHIVKSARGVAGIRLWWDEPGHWVPPDGVSPARAIAPYFVWARGLTTDEVERFAASLQPLPGDRATPVVSATSTAVSTPPAPAGWTTTYDATHGFEISYPAGWDLQLTDQARAPIILTSWTMPDTGGGGMPDGGIKIDLGPLLASLPDGGADYAPGVDGHPARIYLDQSLMLGAPGSTPAAGSVGEARYSLVIIYGTGIQSWVFSALSTEPLSDGSPARTIVDQIVQSIHYHP